VGRFVPSISHYETDFGVSSAYGAGNTKISFLKPHRKLTYKEPKLDFLAPAALENPILVS
jgi:hypothetical protein